MVDPKRLCNATAICRELQQQNAHLLRKLANAERELRELEAVNANLRVERDAADALLGVAMDEALGEGDHA